jgi:hypothetical protein
MSNTAFTPTRLEQALEAYLEQTIKYLHTPSPEGKELLLEKMKDYSQSSGIILHFEKLQKQLASLERDYESAWELFANEAERSWFFHTHPELQEMFFEAAHKRGLAKKKWVICSV